MAQEFSKRFYNSAAWKKCRQSYIDARISYDGGICEECRCNPGYIVHHKETLTEITVHDPEIALNHEMLKYVCKDCHDRYEGHGIGNKNQMLFTFDANGQPISHRKIDGGDRE